MAFPLTYHRITNSNFRHCSTRQSRSQARFCVYTLRMVSVHAERTFERLRYSFRRRPPQSNCPPDNVPRPDSRPQVRIPVLQGWYPNGDSTQTDAMSFPVSHLSCTCNTETQYQATVKLHGVFPSCRG